MRVIVDAENKTGSALSAVGKDLDKVEKKVRDLGPAFQKMALAGTAATAALGFAMKKSIDAAVDLGESMNAVNVVFGDGADKILAYGETASKTVGLSNAAFNQMATITGALLKDTGLGMDEVADQTTMLAQRAADMASVFNTDVNDAMSAINQAIRGETEAIRRYAGDVTDASVETYLLSKGIQKSVKDMTEQEKRLYRVELIMSQTAVTANDFANTSDSLANKQRVLAAQWQDMQAKLGQQLIPVMEKIYAVIGPVVEKVGAWIEQNPKLAAGIMLAATGLTALVAVVGTLGIAILAFSAIAWPVVGIVAAITLGVGALIAAGVLLYKNWDEITAFAGKAWDAIASKIMGALEAIKGFFVSIWEGIKTALQTYIYFIVGLVALMLDQIWPNWEAGLTAMFTAWQNIWASIKQFFETTWGALKVAFEAMSGFFKGIWTAIVEVFLWAKDEIGEVFDWITEKIEPIFDLLDKAISKVKEVGRGVGDALGKVVDRGKSVLGARAQGGPVLGGGSYLVGENGPEIFTPATAGRISNGQGGGGLVIQFNGNTFVGREGIADQIMRDIVRELQLRMKVTL